MDPKYDVCFAGELQEGQNLADVRSGLGKLFKADEATLDKLFSGKVQLLKRGCDRATALKYQKAMERAGAKPNIRADPDCKATAIRRETKPDTAMTAAERIASLAAAPDAGQNDSSRAVDERESDTAEGDINLAPPGSDVLRPEERVEEEEPNIDTSAIEIMATGVNLSDLSGEPPAAPDTSHLSMGEVGEDIPTLASSAVPISPDIAGISLSPEHSDFSDCAPEPAEAPEHDLSGLILAASGADMLEEAHRPKQDSPVPSTEHLALDEEDGSQKN
jgi:hypothetical protein